MHTTILMPTRINNYEEFKKPLDETTEKNITFEEKGDDFVFEVSDKNGIKQKYSLSKLNKNLIDVYQMQNEKMNLSIKTTENLENLKEDVKKHNEENNEESKEEIKTLTAINAYIETFKARKKATRYNKKYNDGEAGLNLIHDTAKDAIDELKAKKKSLNKAPKWHKNIFDEKKYLTKLKTITAIRDKSTDSERPVKNFQAHDLDDANRNNEYNKETINYQEKFNWLLQTLAADKSKIKDYARLTKYFQDVIDGTITDPSKNPYQCKHRQDYKYLMSLRTKYPKLNIVVHDPDGNTETVNNNSNNNSDNKLNNNNENSETIDNSNPDSILNALKNWSVIDALGQWLNNTIEWLGLDLNFSKQQQQALKIAGVIWWGLLLFKLIRNRWKKRWESNKKRKRRMAGGIVLGAWILYRGNTWRGLFSDTMKTLFGNWSEASKKFAWLFKNNPFNKKTIDEAEEKSEKKPTNLMKAAWRATPANNLFKTKNGKFEINYSMFEQQVTTLPKDMQKDAIDSMNMFMKEDDTNASINKTMAMFGISVKDYENPKNKNKSLVDIANDQKETQKRSIKYVEKELKKRWYEITEKGRYPIYLNWNPDGSDDIDKKLEERKEAKKGRLVHLNPGVAESDRKKEKQSNK